MQNTESHVALPEEASLRVSALADVLNGSYESPLRLCGSG